MLAIVRARRALKGDATQVIDLHCATLFPGSTDAHAHLRDIGERELMLNLEGSRLRWPTPMQRLKARACPRPRRASVIVGVN